MKTAPEEGMEHHASFGTINWVNREIHCRAGFHMSFIVG